MTRPAIVAARRAGKAANVEAWLAAQGLTLAQWQRNLVLHYFGPPTDQEYLLHRLNTRWRDNADPGPWERDRMRR